MGGWSIVILLRKHLLRLVAGVSAFLAAHYTAPTPPVSSLAESYFDTFT